MTPIQFKLIMQSLDDLRSDANEVKRRLQRVEVGIATMTGGLILAGFLVSSGMIRMGG